MKWFENLEEVMEHYTSTGGFLTSSFDGKINTMTVSWGFIGYLWNKPVIIALVRPQRYTKEFLDKSESFTLSVPFGELKKELGTCGSKSGRDIDKSEVVNFVKAKSVDDYIVDGCDAYFECKQILDFQMDKGLIAQNILDTVYPADDLHYIYVGEIVERY